MRCVDVWTSLGANAKCKSVCFPKCVAGIAKRRKDGQNLMNVGFSQRLIGGVRNFLPAEISTQMIMKIELNKPVSSSKLKGEGQTYQYQATCGSNVQKTRYTV